MKRNIWPAPLGAQKPMQKRDSDPEKEGTKKRTRKRFVAADARSKLNKVIKAPSTWSSPTATTTQNTPPNTLPTRIE